MNQDLVDEIEYMIDLLTKSGFFSQDEILEILEDQFIEYEIDFSEFDISPNDFNNNNFSVLEKTFKKLSEKIIIVGGEENIYLISVEKYNILNKYNINSGCYSICAFLNGIILTGHYNGYIRQYNLINDELKFIGEKKMHNDRIRVITLLKDNFIFSGSDDHKINIYKI